MADYVTLLGSEQVARAGYNMQHAGEQMQQAAANMDASVDRLLRGLDDFVLRFENATALLTAVKERGNG